MRTGFLASGVWYGVAFVGIAYILIVLVAALFQRRLLYFPDRLSRSAVEKVTENLGLQLWADDGQDYLGYLRPEPPTPSAGTVMVFHGNAGSAFDRLYYVQALEQLDYRVLLYEYPGYAARPGVPSETTFVEDATRALERARDEFPKPLIVWGESLGCGVATALVRERMDTIDGVVLLTPWASLPQLAQSLYWYLPARWLVQDKYDNVANMKNYPGPVAVVAAARDEIIPPKQTSRLRESLTGQSKLWTFDGAGHNTWPSAPGLDWWAEVMEFVSDR